MNQKYDAELSLEYLGVGLSGKVIASGKVFADTKTDGNHPFPDGVDITTSVVLNPDTCEKEGFIRTKNTIYKIQENSPWLVN